ncbi:alpha/beta fold hydrolase [Deltaproteobacteria bacterium TL4]
MAPLAQQKYPLLMEDGTYSCITIYRQEQPRETQPVVLCTPALGVTADFYDPLVKAMLKKGWNVVTCDLRGHGYSSVRVSKKTRFGFYEVVTQDWPVIVNATRQQFPGQPLFLCGHSLSGNLNAFYSAIHNHQIQGLILIASCSIYYRGWPFPQNFNILFSTQLARVIAELLGYFPGKQLKFAGTESIQMMRDWTITAVTGRYHVPQSPYDFEKLLQSLKLPILMLSFESDSFVTQRAVENLAHKMSQARLTHWHLTPEDLNGHNVDHFQWVKKVPEPVVQKIADWMKAEIGFPR